MKERLNSFRVILLIFIFLSSLSNIIFLFNNVVDNKKNKMLKSTYKVETIKNKDKIENVVDVTRFQNAVDKLRSEFNNMDIYGTLKINGTTIDTVLVQGDDNDFYLNHSINKEQNKVGSVFMDYRNNKNDKIKLFYGHNSRSLNPDFHELEKFLNEDFAKEHVYAQLMDDSGLYNYKIFSVMVIPNSTNRHMQIHFDDNNSYQTHLDWLKGNSKFVLDENVNYNDDIILLQTCYYYPDNSFIVIAAKRI